MKVISKYMHQFPNYSFHSMDQLFLKIFNILGREMTSMILNDVKLHRLLQLHIK